MLKKTITICILCFIFLVGCIGEEKLNTENDKAYAESFDKVYSSLSEEQKKDFLYYISILIEGKATHLYSEQPNIPSYEQALKLYEIVHVFGGKNDEERFQTLNGKVASEIIDEGKQILIKTLNEEKNKLEKNIQEQQAIVKKIQLQEQELIQAQEQIHIHITNPITVTGSPAPFNKQILDKMLVFITVENQSKYTLIGFKNSTIDLFYESGTEYPNFSPRGLDTVATKTGGTTLAADRPFQYSSFGNSKGLSPHSTFDGEIVIQWLGITPYPLAEKVVAKLVQQEVTPIFEEFQRMKSSEDALNLLKKIEKNLQIINTKIAASK